MYFEQLTATATKRLLRVVTNINYLSSEYYRRLLEMLSRARKSWLCCRSEEANLIEIFKPLYVLLLMLGLFPCSITFPKGKYSKIEQKSMLISLICTLIMISSVGICLALNVNDRITRSVSMSGINYFIETALFIASTFVGYFCVFYYRHVHLNTLNTVMLTWSELANNDAMHILKQFRFMVWVLILGWILILIGGYTILSCINKLSAWVIVTALLPEMVPSGVVALYNGVGLMLASLLKNIEHQCGQLADNDKLNKTGFVRVKPKRFQVTVGQLELAYKKTLEMKREVNTAFQAILLIITLQTFHTVLYEAHTLYRGVMKTDSFKAIDIVQSLHWIIYQTLKMYAISFPGTMIENDENQIGKALLCIPAESVQIFTEVQHFSSLMIYQETQMTAYGYFALDTTLVFNTFAAVATYLVILVQFDS